MLKRKLAYIFVIIISLVGSFFAGYYTTMRYTDRVIKNNTNMIDQRVSAQTSIEPKNDFISNTTQVIERQRYTKGVEYLKETKSSASPDIIGMDRESAEKYYRDKGYVIVEFTSQEVIVSRDIDEWAPGTFVVKSENDIVNVYKVDDKGNLSFVKSTDITLEELPEQDKQEVIKGKIYEQMDDVDTLIEDYSS